MATQPLPIASAPREPDRTLLLFCPDQGGWHSGEWWTVDGPGRWVAVIDASIRLHPSHWCEPPADPLGALGVLHFVMAKDMPVRGERLGYVANKLELRGT